MWNRCPHHLYAYSNQIRPTPYSNLDVEPPAVLRMLNTAPDAIAMVAAITAADPFAAPTLLLLKDRLAQPRGKREYTWVI